MCEPAQFTNKLVLYEHSYNTYKFFLSDPDNGTQLVQTLKKFSVLVGKFAEMCIYLKACPGKTFYCFLLYIKIFTVYRHVLDSISICTKSVLLDTAYSSSSNKQLYNMYDNQLIKFQPDTATGWHAYAVTNTAKEVPADVLKNMLNDGLISKPQYKKFLKNK